MNRRAAGLILMLATTLPVAAAAALPDRMATARVASLKPGQYLWDAADSGTGPVAIMVSIDRQHLYVWRGGALIGISTVSTGKPGKATPLGEFRILQKNVHHRSNIYSNAPMPYMQRLTWTGIAIHGGDLPGYPASHGCIRVPLAFAKLLFAATDMGGVVSVSDGQSGPFLRIEAEIAALATDAILTGGWPTAGEARPVVRMAALQPDQRVLAPVRRHPDAILPLVQDRDVAANTPAPKLPVEKIALAQADLSVDDAAMSSGRADPAQPHWRVPYYEPPGAPAARK